MTLELIEVVIGSVTALTLGAFVLAGKVTKWELEAEAKFAPTPEPPPPPPLMDPALARAARAAVTEKRRILQGQLERTRADEAHWNTVWHEAGCATGHHLDNMNSDIKQAQAIERALIELADEEAEIPLYETEEKKA